MYACLVLLVLFPCSFRLGFAQALLVRSYRWYRFRKWGKDVGRRVQHARRVLQRNLHRERRAFWRFVAIRRRAAIVLQCWARRMAFRRRVQYRRDHWKLVFRDRVRKAIPKLQAWFRKVPAAYRWREMKWAVPIIQVWSDAYHLLPLVV